MVDAIAEGNWLVSLPEQIKARFLARLAWELTIAGRSTYEPQTEQLIHPEHLRRINEIQHRVTSCLTQLLYGGGDADFERSIAGWLIDVHDPILLHQTSYAWANAKARVAQMQPNPSSSGREEA